MVSTLEQPLPRVALGPPRVQIVGPQLRVCSETLLVVGIAGEPLVGSRSRGDRMRASKMAGMGRRTAGLGARLMFHGLLVS